MSPASAPAGYPDPDVRPTVRTAPAGTRAVWIFGAAMLLAALLLFEALSVRRERLAEPATQAIPSNGAMVTAPPPLVLPQQFREATPPVSPAIPLPMLPAASLASPPRVVTRFVDRPLPRRILPPPPAAPSVPQPAVIEARSPPAETDLSAAAAPAVKNERILAGRLASPALTVPQGTVIAAVLETALDSTRPGGVRALVQRDVMGFDGTRVLIPRGSRLYGEYGSDVGAGQKRALIHWTRLTRPDAVIMNLDSPSADPLGRAGVEGKVNTHFFERFGGAILQSVLDIGVGLATRSVTDNGVILAVPTSAMSVTQPPPIAPTLKVKQGTSVSVFVARDLDFSSVDQ